MSLENMETRLAARIEDSGGNMRRVVGKIHLSVTTVLNNTNERLTTLIEQMVEMNGNQQETDEAVDNIAARLNSLLGDQN